VQQKALLMLKQQASSFVEIKTVTWTKDSHGLFDYESKSVNFTKNKVESSSKLFKEGNEVAIRTYKETEFAQAISSEGKAMDYLFSVTNDDENNNSFSLKIDQNQTTEEAMNKDLFLIARSLKHEDGTQKGYGLELGDIIRLGRIEYRVIEFQTHDSKISSLLSSSSEKKSLPFTLAVKDCNSVSNTKKQCRICLMDETDSDDILVSPCSCKGTSEYVHIKCLQDWISSKGKKKVNPNTTCFYWKKLNCEVCKVSHPDLVEIEGQKLELVPISRPENPYILVERVFYDKSKTGGDNSKTMILLSLTGEDQQIKLGRGHECDLRENDISVSRLHAFIKYQDGQFVVFDNNSKFGTLVLLRKDFKIEKKKIALQIGRTVITFSLKQSSVNNVPVFKDPTLMEKLTKRNSPTFSPENKSTTLTFTEKQQEANIQGTFIDFD
jgi:translation elongation factor P/translation initiation factor 5A